MLALGTDEFVIAGILPAVADDLRVSPGTAGQLVTAFGLAFAVGAPVLAVITDRVDRRTLLVAGLGMLALGTGRRLHDHPGTAGRGGARGRRRLTDVSGHRGHLRSGGAVTATLRSSPPGSRSPCSPVCRSARSSAR
ncbi:MFS transporter [Saccharomonospora azurea]